MINIGFYILVFLIPFTSCLVSFGIFHIPMVNFINHIEMPLVDLVGIFLFVAFLIKQLYFFLGSKRNLNIKWPLISAWLFFLGACLASAVNSEYWFNSVWYVLRWVLFFYLVYIWLPFNILQKEKYLKYALISFILSGVVVAGMGILSLFFQDWSYEFVRVKPIGLVGIYPLGTNHNLIAEILIVAAFFALSLKYWFSSNKANKLINILSIIFILVLIGTFSRAAWLALFIQLIVYAIVKYKIKGETFPKKYNALVAAFIIFIFLPLSMYMASLQMSHIGIGATENRLLLTQISWERFLDKPLLGYGSGTYMDLVNNNIRYRAQYGEALESHGIWQKLVAENGILGVIAFAFFSFCIFRIFFKALKKYPEKIKLLLPLVVGSLGIYFFEFFNTSYYKGKLWLPIALALAAVNLACHKNSHEHKKN